MIATISRFAMACGFTECFEGIVFLCIKIKKPENLIYILKERIEDFLFGLGNSNEAVEDNSIDIF
ncbi:hypothetical protein ES703_104785 [subsurface metagenome]